MRIRRPDEIQTERIERVVAAIMAELCAEPACICRLARVGHHTGRPPQGAMMDALIESVARDFTLLGRIVETLTEAEAREIVDAFKEQGWEVSYDEGTGGTIRVSTICIQHPARDRHGWRGEAVEAPEERPPNEESPLIRGAQRAIQNAAAASRSTPRPYPGDHAGNVRSLPSIDRASGPDLERLAAMFGTQRGGVVDFDGSEAPEALGTFRRRLLRWADELAGNDHMAPARFDHLGGEALDVHAGHIGARRDSWEDERGSTRHESDESFRDRVRALVYLRRMGLLGTT